MMKELCEQFREGVIHPSELISELYKEFEGDFDWIRDALHSYLNSAEYHVALQEIKRIEKDIAFRRMIAPKHLK